MQKQIEVQLFEEEREDFVRFFDVLDDVMKTLIGLSSQIH